jgi:hypothetical protein
MADPVEAFAYLWTTERDDWIVLRLDPEEAGLAYNRASRGVLLIEDDELSDAVVQRMIAEGLSVVTAVSK